MPLLINPDNKLHWIILKVQPYITHKRHIKKLIFKETESKYRAIKILPK